MRLLLATLTALAMLPLAIVAVLFALPFWIVSWLTACIGRLIEPAALDWQKIIRFEPEVGWKPRPGLSGWAHDFNGDPFHLTTDADGWRGHGDIDHADVLVFGDSFAFGDATDDRTYFAHQGGNVRIKAVAASGYNMVQALWWMEHYAPRLRGKVVAWLIYPGNDLEDNLRPQMGGYRMPFVREAAGGGWESVTSHVRPEPWSFPFRRTNVQNFVEICRPTYLSERAFAACRHLILRANDVCERAGARLVVLTIPDLAEMETSLYDGVLKQQPALREDFDPGLPDRRIGAICGEAGIRFIALSDHLDADDYLRFDVHWNARGHSRVASVLRGLARDGTMKQRGAAIRAVRGPAARRVPAGIGTRTSAA